MGRLAAGMARGLLVTTLLLSPGVSIGAQTTQYTYDALGRVLSAIDGSGRKVVYTYDSAGNRTRVSNGAEFQEIVPTAWTASSNAGTTGLATANAFKDGDFGALASIHATNAEANAWISADLGSIKTVNHIDVAPAIAPAVGATPDDLDATVVEYSIDGAKWSAAATVTGVSPGATRTIALGGISARYVRIRRMLSGQVAIGDLRLFSAAVANSPLIAQPDEITSTGSAVTFDPRSNDQDLDGYAFTISSVEDPPHGTAVINSGLSITYTPDTGYIGADSFLYSVADGHNGTASARVTVLVRPSTNHAPVAVADSFTVSDRVTAVVDGLNSLRPLANDYDADGDIITITAKTNPAHGTLTLVGGNLLEYQPAVSYTGTDSFTYTISDGRGGPTSTATVTLNVANAAPVAGTDNVTAQRDAPVTFDPRLNDRDPNGDVITVTAIGTTPTRGVATLNADQSITYQPNGAINLSDAFTYTLTDARGATATGMVAVAIPGNSVPVARHDALAASGAPVSLDPRANDSDPDGDPLTIIAITQPAHGATALNATGVTVTYSPSSGYTGDDSFTYTVSDNQGGSATATVAVNALALDYLVVGGGGGGGRGGSSGSGAGGGGGGGGGVRQGTLVLPANGVLTATVGGGGSGGAEYALSSSGQPSAFGGIAAQGGGAGANGGGGGGAGSAGASGGGGSAGAGGSGVAGQGFAGGLGSTYTSGGGGGAGSAGGAGAQSCVGYACPGTAGSGGRGTDSAIGGGPANYAAGGGGGGHKAWAGGDTYREIIGGAPGGPSGGYGGRASSNVPTRDAQGWGGGGGGGSYVWNEGGGFEVSEAGAGGAGVVIVRYAGAPRATGGTITQFGGYTIHTFAANGSFTSPAANTSPVAANDTLTAVSGVGRAFDPRTNDTDANGDALKVASVGTAGHGTVTFNSAGDPLIYTPAAGYSGPDSFTYTISDGHASATATVNVTVIAGTPIEYLIVAGGGGGWVGGGGGGGVRTGTLYLPSGDYPVTVGAGGAGGARNWTPGTNGGDSSVAGLVAVGGGAGGRSGGSGGGAGPSPNGGSPGGGFIPGQGHAGGASRGSHGRGGGGGAGGPGGGASAGSVDSGAGGPGLTSTISGAARVYGSGGGGGYQAGFGVTLARAGLGGPNAGDGTSGNGADAAPNMGGGGGGEGWPYDSEVYYTGGSGGSGVVILRYPTGALSVTGGAVTTAGGYTIRTYTSSATVTVVAPNTAPVATNDTALVTYNTAKVINPRLNDTDADGDLLSVTVVNNGTHGTTAISDGGATVTYTPGAGYTGADSFTYTVSDGRGGSASATVNVWVQGTTVTWSPTDKSGVITLSNGSLTATVTGLSTTYFRGLRATTSRASGKWYFEMAAATLPTSNQVIGLAPSTLGLSQFPGQTSTSWGLFPDAGGFIYNNGAPLSGHRVLGLTGGSVVGIAVDFINNRLWMRNGSGIWNNSTTADPATNVGGIPITAGTYFPFWGGVGNGSTVDTVVANFGATAFTATAPSGFAPWDAMTAPAP